MKSAVFLFGCYRLMHKQTVCRHSKVAVIHLMNMISTESTRGLELYYHSLIFAPDLTVKMLRLMKGLISNESVWENVSVCK